MKEKNTLNEVQLGKVAGGEEASDPPKYHENDQVRLIVYPEYGVGTVLSVYPDGSGWKCSAQFSDGIMDASEDEFEPA
ncbi:MAG: hypothetical protein K6G83_08045 [Lachnospiraceae bacterium]|nr:hypothetical protein [Lachnospiraceae bacterium]